MIKLIDEFNGALVPVAVSDETTVLYKGAEGRIVVPHSFKAANYWSPSECETEQDFDHLTTFHAPVLALPAEGSAVYLGPWHLNFDEFDGSITFLEGLSQRGQRLVQSCADSLSPELSKSVFSSFFNAVPKNSSAEEKKKRQVWDVKYGTPQWSSILDKINSPDFNDINLVPKWIFDDKDFISFLADNIWGLRFMTDTPDEILRDEQVAIAIIRGDANLFEFLPKDIQANKGFVKKLLRSTGLAFNFKEQNCFEFVEFADETINQYKYKFMKDSLNSEDVRSFSRYAALYFKPLWDNPELLYGVNKEESLTLIAKELGVEKAPKLQLVHSVSKLNKVPKGDFS